MKNFINILLVTLLSLSSVYAVAQQSDTLKIQRNAQIRCFRYTFRGIYP